MHSDKCGTHLVGPNFQSITHPMHVGDTIAAISTPVQRAARIIVRLSGPSAFDLVSVLTSETLPRQRGLLRVPLSFDRLTFPVTLYCFIAPASYSGEDLIELHIPGNPWLADRLLQTLLAAGARLAEPGEFTARAYFNGRLDLTAAEGVAAAVSAASARESDAARRLLSGELSRRLQPILDQLAQTLALVEVGIDFVDEDVSFLEREACERQVNDVDRQLAELIDASVSFERLAHEPTIALAGRPNAGKSTLLNTLASTSRAIVSPVEGTTRDVIWAHVDLPRGRVRIADLAGLEPAPQSVAGRARIPSKSATSDVIVGQMREHALRSIAEADVLVVVHALDDERPPIRFDQAPSLVVRTKSDLFGEPTHRDGQQLGKVSREVEPEAVRHPERIQTSDEALPSPLLVLRERVRVRVLGCVERLCGSRRPLPPPSPGVPGEGEMKMSPGPLHSVLGAGASHQSIRVSGHTGDGIPALRAALDYAAFGSKDDQQDASSSRLALNARHLECLRSTRAALKTARSSAAVPELLAADLRLALDHLGAISGVVTPDDLLGRIFSAFCIGK